MCVCVCARVFFSRTITIKLPASKITSLKDSVPRIETITSRLSLLTAIKYPTCSGRFCETNKQTNKSPVDTKTDQPIAQLNTGPFFFFCMRLLLRRYGDYCQTRVYRLALLAAIEAHVVLLSTFFGIYVRGLSSDYP